MVNQRPSVSKYSNRQANGCTVSSVSLRVLNCVFILTEERSPFPGPHSLMSYLRLGEMEMGFLLFINYGQSNLKREELRTSAQLMNLLISFLSI